MNNVDELSKICQEIKKNTEVGMIKCNYLKRMGKLKVLFLVIKTLFKNLPIEPTMLDSEEFKADIGFIIPVK